MAFVYKKETATNTADCLDRIIANLVAAGWTLYDDQTSAGTPYAILSSNGSLSAQMTMYCYLGMDIANRLQHYFYLDWNNSTHVGVARHGSTSYTYLPTLDASSFDMWTSADEDGFVITTYTSGTYNQISTCLIVPLHNEAEGELASGISSGSNVTITLGSGEADGFKVGVKYQIVGANGEGRDPVVVNAVNTGSNQITVNTISRSYSAGAIVGDLPFKWAIFNSRNSSAMVFALRVDGSGTTAESTYCSVNYNMISDNAIDPDSRTSGDDDMYILYPIMVYDASSSAGVIGIQDPSCLLLRADLATTNSGDTISVGDIDTGTSSGSNTSTTLNDTSKSWSTDVHANKVVIITAGLGAGQIRVISSNTGTALTISEDWDTTPDATSEYTICEEGWRFFYYNNNAAYQSAVRCG